LLFYSKSSEIDSIQNSWDMDVNNSELMEADEDEEGIDEMNDLTFGNDLCKLSHIPNLCWNFKYLMTLYTLSRDTRYFQKL